MLAGWHCAALNILTSVSLILLNKHIFSSLGFPFSAALTAFHLCMTALAARIAGSLGLFEIKDVPRKEIAVLVVLRIGCILAMNLSLLQNSVSFYQLSKISILPCTVLCNYVLRGRRVPPLKAFLLLLTSVGVALAVVTSPTASIGGTVTAAVAVAFCTASIIAGEHTKMLGLSSLQMMYLETPLSAAASTLLVPLLEDTDALWDFPIGFRLAAFLSLTALCAVCINFTGFMTVVRLSAVDYLMCGHLKTVLVLGLGFMSEPPAAQVVGGSCIALLGLLGYVYTGLPAVPAGKKE